MTQTQEVVRLIATTKKYERAPFFYAPEFGPDGKVIYYFDYDKSLSEEEKVKLKESLRFTAESDENGVLKLHHLMRLDISQSRDKAIFLHLKNAPLGKTPVALDKTNSNPSKHRFYIENKELEARQSVKGFSVKFKAMNLANEILTAQSAENDTVRDALRLLGIPVKGLSNAQLQNALLKESETGAVKFINMLDDKNRDYRIFIIKLIERGIVNKSKSGSYSYEDEKNVIAMNEHQMIVFLQENENANLVRIWADTINDKRILGKKTFVSEKGIEEKETVADAGIERNHFAELCVSLLG